MSLGVPDEINPWLDASLIAACFAIDPFALGGINLRAQPGPVRDLWLEQLQSLFVTDIPIRKIPINVSLSRLIGGVDLAATLQTGKVTEESGLLEQTQPTVLCLAMAERIEPRTMAIIGIALDKIHPHQDSKEIPDTKYQQRFSVIALDEGITPEETVAAQLKDRLSFELLLDGISLQQATNLSIPSSAVKHARSTLPQVQFKDEYYEAICGIAFALGIDSMRAPLFAKRVALCLAALNEHPIVTEDDLQQACRLVLFHRATQIPSPPSDEEDESESSEQEQQPPKDNSDELESSDQEQDINLDDIVTEVMQSVLSQKILEQLKHDIKRQQAQNISGRSQQFKINYQRGRPLGVRQGNLGNGARLNIIETLRAAAPWQKIRRNFYSETLNPDRLMVRNEDFRINRFKQATATTTIFIVDASGSSALNRLAEVKGAVQMLLGECYKRRDSVSLVTFRGTSAEITLPPTRSLARAKKMLVGLPGGGATPLAIGLETALKLAHQLLRKDEKLSIVLMTDGRANIDIQGAVNRQGAFDDALMVSKQIRMLSIPALFIDTSPREQKNNRTIAEAMGASYTPLPHANAASISKTIQNQMSESSTDIRSAHS